MDRVRQLVEAKAAERGLALSEISLKIGKNHAYLQQFLRRGVPVALPEIVRHRLAGLIGVEESDLRPVELAVDYEDKPTEPRPPSVRIVGYVGSGAEVHFYAISQEDMDMVAAPEEATPQTVALEVRGQALGPLLDRWLLFYDDLRRPYTPENLGRTCIIAYETGRMAIEKLNRSHASYEIAWVAEIKHMINR